MIQLITRHTLEQCHPTREQTVHVHATMQTGCAIQTQFSVPQVPTLSKISHYPPGNHHVSHFGADDPTLSLSPKVSESGGSSAPVVSRWLWPGNGTFSKVVSMVITWWIVPFSRSAITAKQEQATTLCDTSTSDQQREVNLRPFDP